ncbi:MAG: trigger factor [Candidatus Korobacteraceae bacterium]
MTATETNPTTRREVQVEVSTEAVNRETEKVVQKFQKFAKLPGFRSGKVPASIIRQRFSDDIRSEVLEALIPRHFRQEAEKLGLVPVSQPQVTDLHMHEGEPLRFKASFDVLPPIEVTGYEGLHIEKPDTNVSEQEVEDVLSELREQHSSYTPVEGRPLQDGDFAQAAVVGKPVEVPQTEEEADDGEQKEAPKPVELDDVLVEIGGKATVAEFTENLRGASAGEERSFEVNYPEDFSDQRLAGKRFQYTVQIKGVKNKELPEMNDAFAKELGVESMEEVRSILRSNLEKRKQSEAEREGKEKIMEELLKQHSFEVPDSLVDHQVDVRLERGLRALAAQGMKAEDMKRMDLNRLRAGQREAALRDVKSALLLERIAEKENIEVTEAELDEEIQAIAQQSQQTPDAVRSRLGGEGALERMRSRLRNDKALDYLYQRSA